MSEYPGVTSVRFPDSQIWKPDILLYNRFVIFTQRVINQPISITGLSKKEFHRNQTYLQKFKPGLGTISWELVNCLGIKVLVTVNGHWVCTTPRKTKVWPHLSLSTGKAVADGEELASSESATEDEEFATICWRQSWSQRITKLKLKWNQMRC